MKTIIKKMLVLYCVIFTLATIVSSTLQLVRGIAMDGNLHIIDRAIVTLIGVITITLLTNMNLKNKFLNILLPYVIAMALFFFYVWLTGFWDALHPNAYRDIFVNFTAAFILVAIVLALRQKFTA